MPDYQAEYRLTPKARDDMEAVLVYSLNQWGVEQTDHYIDELTTTFSFLADSPLAGTGCEHIRLGYRRFPLIRHVIYYRVTAYGIEVIRVLHDRMLATRYL